MRKSELSKVVCSSILPVRNPLPRGTERHEADAKLLKRRQHFLLRFAEPQRILALHRRDRLDCVRAADCLCRGFGQPEVFDVALLNQILHCAGNVFNRNFGVHAMLIVEVDGIDLQPPERAFDNVPDVLRPAITSPPLRFRASSRTS